MFVWVNEAQAFSKATHQRQQEQRNKSVNTNTQCAEKSSCFMDKFERKHKRAAGYARKKDDGEEASSTHINS